jgi:hypothetical protein
VYRRVTQVIGEIVNIFFINNRLYNYPIMRFGGAFGSRGKFIEVVVSFCNDGGFWRKIAVSIEPENCICHCYASVWRAMAVAKTSNAVPYDWRENEKNGRPLFICFNFDLMNGVCRWRFAFRFCCDLELFLTTVFVLCVVI